MTRFLAVSVVSLTLALLALGAQAADLNTVTCKAYETSNHEDMAALDAAFHEVLKGDATLGTLSKSEVGDTIDKACAAHPDAKVIDALSSR
jgi:hypothetical protein